MSLRFFLQSFQTMPGSLIPKTAAFELLHFFFKNRQNESNEKSHSLPSHIRILYMQWIQSRMGEIWETQQKYPKKDQKVAIFGLCPQLLFLRFERNFV